MSCANIGATILSLLIIVLSIWPTIFSQAITQWIIMISAFLIIVLVWSSMECKYCGAEKPKTKSKNRR